MQIGDQVYLKDYPKIVGVVTAVERPSWAEEPWVSIEATDGFTYQERQSNVQRCETATDVLEAINALPETERENVKAALEELYRAKKN